MLKPIGLAFAIAALDFILSISAFSQSSAFTYQGKLTDGGAAANGQHDLLSKLFSDAGDASQIGSDELQARSGGVNSNFTGSVYIANPSSLVVSSPNGSCWFTTVSNTGVLSSFTVTCP